MFVQLINTPLRGVKLLKFGSSVIQTATITSRATRGEPLKLMKPFPYEEKKFSMLDRFLDNTMLRVGQENAKILVVDGPIGVGKSACAKILAEQLDMVFMPEPTMDFFYILPSGYDLRVLDKELPECIQTYDHKNFCTNPKDNRALHYQISMLYMRFFQYMDALCHLLNTGQGVVLERSYFSDYVFTKAMYEHQYISRLGLSTYFEMKRNTNTFFPPPHLIIYLDIPVPVVQERIRTRGYSYEQNSPALTNEYLQSIEKFYKQDFLKEASKYSEILVYNWTDGGDVDIIIEDIEGLDFNILRRDGRFDQWRMTRKQLYLLRAWCTNEKWDFSKYFYIPVYKIPELDIPNSICLDRDVVYQQAPDVRYDIGYDPKRDSIFNILFKSNMERHRMQKHYLGYYHESDHI